MFLRKVYQIGFHFLAFIHYLGFSAGAVSIFRHGELNLNTVIEIYSLKQTLH